MKCNMCKIKDATVHLTEIINNKVTKLHLCEGCARAKSQEMEEHFGLADLLSGLADLVPMAREKKKGQTEPALKCASCGFTFQHFRKMGRLGCPKCYDAFRSQLSPLLKKIHGADAHTGKMPVKTKTVRGGKATLLSELKARLEKAIASEEFEEAARLRDQIRSLEKKRPKKK